MSYSSYIWKIKVPSKVKAFILLVINDIIICKDGPTKKDTQLMRIARNHVMNKSDWSRLL